jgi:hypothetical protein
VVVCKLGGIGCFSFYKNNQLHFKLWLFKSNRYHNLCCALIIILIKRCSNIKQIHYEIII